MRDGNQLTIFDDPGEVLKPLRPGCLRIDIEYDGRIWRGHLHGLAMHDIAHEFNRLPLALRQVKAMAGRMPQRE